MSDDLCILVCVTFFVFVSLVCVFVRLNIHLPLTVGNIVAYVARRWWLWR